MFSICAMMRENIGNEKIKYGVPYRCEVSVWAKTIYGGSFAVEK